MEMENIVLRGKSCKQFLLNHTDFTIKDEKFRGFLWDVINTKKILLRKEPQFEDKSTVDFVFVDSFAGKPVEITLGYVIEGYDDYNWEMIQVESEIKFIQ